MFAKLKKKIAEETAVAQRPGGAARIPRSVSKESVASVGADSGDDFVSTFSSGFGLLFALGLHCCAGDQTQGLMLTRHTLYPNP